jgi:hypothetical protein
MGPQPPNTIVAPTHSLVFTRLLRGCQARFIDHRTTRLFDIGSYTVLSCRVYKKDVGADGGPACESHW